MICENCKKNTATVHVVKIVNGTKQQVMLCEQCANIVADIPLTPTLDELDSFGFQKLINGLVGYMNNAKENKKDDELVCKSCGTTYKEFKEKGVLGCGQCYEIFSTTITPVIKRVQVDLEHIGKVPKKYGKFIMEKRKVVKLKEELQKAILVEEYERAAELRDEIKRLLQVIEDEEEKQHE